MTSPVSNTKLLPPRLAGVVLRQRLFDHIDTLRESGCRLLWLAGAPGSGKTTLAAAYVAHQAAPLVWLRLDADDADPATLLAHLAAAVQHAAPGVTAALPAVMHDPLGDITRQVRQFLRALFAAPGLAAVAHWLVLDDVQAIGGPAACEPLLGVLLEELPAGWCMLATSRQRAPETLARALVNGVAAELPGPSLAFTLEETRHFLQLRHGRSGDAQALHEATQGWAAALVLRAAAGAGEWRAAGAGDAQRQIHAYLNAEVLRALNAAERRGLLQLAWLPAVRPAWALALGVPAGTLRRLESMAGNGILVQTYTSNEGEAQGQANLLEYCFHPLFGDFLRERARAASTGRQLLAAQRAVVTLLQGAGMAEAALALLLDMGAWPEACDAMVALAPAALAAARHRSVIGWAHAVPDNRRSPWLLFWLGQAQMVDDPARGRDHVRQAYALFKRDSDPAPRQRALAAILATHFFEYSTLAAMSPWLAEFQALGADYDTLADDSLRAVAVVGVWSSLVVRHPQHAELPRWQARMHELLALEIDPNVKIRGAMLLGKHYWYTGQHARAWPLVAQVAGELDKPGVVAYSRLVWQLLLVYDAWCRDDLARGRQTVHAALAIAEHVGIRVIDCHLWVHAACFALAQGDEAAAALLDHAAALHRPSRRIETWHLSCTRAWQALLAQQHTRAIEHAAIALDAAAPIGPPPQCMALVAMCHALLGAGDEQALLQRLQRLTALATASRNPWAQFQAHLIEAQLAQGLGSLERCHGSLRAAFAIGRANHLYSFLFAQPRMLASLCGEALAAGIEADYARELIRRRRLLPPEPAALRQAWLWPLRITTLGHFGLVIDGAPLATRGKAQKKSLELLKAVVALGGRDVEVPELADLLWPDAEGDAARSAFDMALHRLRKLLVCEDAVLVHGGQLSLNPDRCWVDVWAFEAGVAGLAGHEAAAAAAIDLYQGSFLRAESGPGWLQAARERLRLHFVRAVLALGQTATEAGRWQEAEALYQHAIDREPAVEDLYRRLMICQQQRHDQDALLHTYERCRDSLASLQGAQPSEATEALLRAPLPAGP